jgi:trehalose 6-phosphate synthase/phosphatase
MEKYSERKKMIEENISRINGLYGDVHWQPVIYQYRHLSFHQLLSFYTVADIALITPLRDGMNLVAKEYVASRRDKKGVLVLSEFAGAAHELTGAILVNPNDLATMKEGLLKALTLSNEEQSLRMHQMRKTIKENDIYKWSSSFLSDLSSASQFAILRTPSIMSFEERRDLIDQYKETSRRLLLFDYDGTLNGFSLNPEDAAPTGEVRDILEQLASQPENGIYIVSGREASWLEKSFSGLNIGLVAEHGSMLKEPKGDWVYLENTELKWKHEVAEIFERFSKRYEGSFSEIKNFSMAYHYRGVDARQTTELKDSIIRELLLLDTPADFNLIQGNMVIEVKSPGSDKGAVTKNLLKQIDYDFVLAIGDDATDEDMFSVLTQKNHHTIKVGIVPSSARCNLINPNNVLSLLGQLSMCKSRLLRQQ